MEQTEHRSVAEEVVRHEHTQLFKECPIPDDLLLQNLGLFLNSKSLSRLLFLDHIYRQIIDVPGVIMEFGTNWGQNLSIFAALRGIYEPFYRHRKIIGFDTFTGFPSVSMKDNVEIMQEGKLSCTPGYEDYLKSIMSCQEADNPMGHIVKFEIRKGDAIVELKRYLKEHPETIIAMAYFDFDLYGPTRDCLSLIRRYLTVGSLVGFDELVDDESPGETAALQETYGVSHIKLRRYQYASRVSYFVNE